MKTVALVFILSVIGLSEQLRDPRCFPPTNIYRAPDCVPDITSENPNFDCQGGHFVRTAGISMPCTADHDCMENMEPNEWCNSERNGFQWAASGCHCDLKLKTCIMQRFDRNYNEIQWAFCTPRNRFRCEVSDHCSPPKN
ncbi:hypothetical protein L5515_016530 [Caenorhabditis briggsae]|uniref:Uncharacterized protein n=1 Tax=Caenorhabditis briggsae TaxID=6238 RepID=A0AAE9JRE6_CAEBR|nr:hypothetical protein L5515_016530 [Caenorhabditis briggsae]